VPSNVGGDPVGWECSTGDVITPSAVAVPCPAVAMESGAGPPGRCGCAITSGCQCRCRCTCGAHPPLVEPDVSALYAQAVVARVEVARANIADRLDGLCYVTVALACALVGRGTAYARLANPVTCALGAAAMGGTYAYWRYLSWRVDVAVAQVHAQMTGLAEAASRRRATRIEATSLPLATLLPAPPGPSRFPGLPGLAGLPSLSGLPAVPSVIPSDAGAPVTAHGNDRHDPVRQLRRELSPLGWLVLDDLLPHIPQQPPPAQRPQPGAQGAGRPAFSGGGGLWATVAGWLFGR
jgi:hypothetical protein